MTMKPRTFVSHTHRHVLVLHESTREPGRYQLTKMLDGVPVGHTTWDEERLAAMSAVGIRVQGAPPVGSKSYVEERAEESASPLGWTEDLRRRGFNAFSWEGFVRYFKLPEQDAVRLLWSSVGRLWRWDGEHWVIIPPKPTF